MSSLRSVIFVPRNDDLSIWAVNGSVVEDPFFDTLKAIDSPQGDKNVR